jgi:hypothetical protein
MKTAHLVLLAALTAASVAANATPSTTDEARAEAGQRIAAAEHAAALRPFKPLDSEVIRVTDTDSARRAAGQANARLAHDNHLAEVLAAGAGFKPTPIAVTDTDSARAAAGQVRHQQQLLAEYADYVKLQAQAALEPAGASNR